MIGLPSRAQNSRSQQMLSATKNPILRALRSCHLQSNMVIGSEILEDSDKFQRLLPIVTF